VLPPAAALALAQQLLDAGRPFHAHEVLEDAWKAAPDAERSLWKGLAQLAVGITHARRGNTHGAAALLRRGAAAVDGFPGRPHGIDAPGLAAAARSLAALIERDGLAAVPAGALTLRLTAAAATDGP
jgi:predicted metal-dependent hydrolase